MRFISFMWMLFTIGYFLNTLCIKAQHARYLLSEKSNRNLPDDAQINIFSMRFSTSEMIKKYTRSFNHVQGPDPFIAAAIMKKNNELTYKDCMQLTELFHTHRDELAKMDEGSMSQQLKTIVVDMTPIRIEEMFQVSGVKEINFVSSPSIIRAHRYLVDETFLLNKHILDDLGIIFTVQIPDSCTKVIASFMRFNENMLSVFRFGAKSQLKSILMHQSQYTSLDYENFGKYFPQNIRENNEFEIHVNDNGQLRGIIDLKELGFAKLTFLDVSGTAIEKVINIPNTVQEIDARWSKIYYNTNLRMEDGSEYRGRALLFS